MKSSFKKVDKGGVSQKCNIGHPELDAVLGNSLSKGHLMVIQEDHPAINYLSILRYFISSNYNDGVTSIVFDGNPMKWKKLVSPPLKRSKEEPTQQKSQKSQIAWRYDQMTMRLSNLAINEKIPFIDLSKQVTNFNENLLRTYEYTNGGLQELYKQIEQAFINAQDSEKDVSGKKLLLSSLPSYIYKHADFSSFLKAVRCLTRSSHLFTVITVPSIMSDSVRSKLIIYSDYYLQMGTIGKGYQDFCGTITILKEVESCHLRSQFRGSTIWGIKKNKKQLRIQSLYEQPLEEETPNEKKSNNQF